MKTSFLSALLLVRLAWATPISPPDSPGHHPAPARVLELLSQAEAGCRRSGDLAGLVEVECLRLEPLLERFEPSCPQRMRALEEKVTSLPPGPARARFFWLQAVYAGKKRDEGSRQSFAMRALQEPELPAAWKAEWLSKMPAWDDTLVQVSWLEGQIRQLLKQDKSAPVRWYLLGAQARLAEMRAQTDVFESLLEARLLLARQEHWGREEMQANQALYRLNYPERKNWDEALSVAARLARDEWTQELFASSPSEADWRRVWGSLRRRPTPLEECRYWLNWRGRSQFADPEKQVNMRRTLVEDARRRGDIEEELRQRFTLYFSLRSAQRIAESLRELEATLQLRLDHPPVEPDWVRTDTSLGSLASLLVSELNNTDHLTRSQALCERALAERWAHFPTYQNRLLRETINQARRFGEPARLEAAVREAVQLLDSLTPNDRLDSLLSLADMVSAEEKAKLLRQAEEMVNLRLKTAAFPIARTTALEKLDGLTRSQGGSSQLGQLWLNEWERAKNAGETRAAEDAAAKVLMYYSNSRMREEFKAFALPLLSDPATGPRLRETCLRGSTLLAQGGDPLALDWVEQQQRLPGPRSTLDEVFRLVRKAEVLCEFERFQAAWDCLDQAEQQISKEKLGYPLVEISRTDVLWKWGRQQQSLDLLARLIDVQIRSEEPRFCLDMIEKAIDHLAELGQDWEGECERRLSQLENLGERGQTARNSLLRKWLIRLAQKQQWERGRSLLARYPWREGPLSQSTKQLRAYPQWSDLFPGAAAPPPAPGEQASLQQVVDELRLNQPELGQLLSLRSTNLKHLQAQLQPKDTLVTYCFQGDDFYLLALRKEGGFYRKQRLTSADFQGTTRRYLESLRSDQTSDAETSLFSMLLAPVLSEDPDQRLFLVPNGPIWQLPFGALRDAQGRALASRAQVVLMGSADLLRLADGDWHPYKLTQSLAIGAPPAADLPGAYQELGEVARALPGCQLRRGDQATLEALYQRDQHWGLLHFASHAHYRPDRPTESDIQLHDGQLKLKQLSQLSLADHALVALSVCQGGASKGQRLDEPVTLATGFSAAGADTVIANLWPVDDEVARVFFQSFYGDLASGSSPCDSFRQAQQACREKFPKARDWGGFFLMGNPG